MLIHQFTMSEAIYKSPDNPGVYVWYCKLCIGKADIKTGDGFLSAIDYYTSKFGQQGMSIEAALNFDLLWKGKIYSDKKKNTDLSSRFTSTPNRLVREIVYNMILRSQEEHHIFFQPLYIGKSEVSLKQRLTQHVNEFRRLKERTAQDDRFYNHKEDSFAQRAIKLGYSEEELVVYTLDIGCPRQLNLNKEQVKEAVSMVELYLNRWSTPILGRR